MKVYTIEYTDMFLSDITKKKITVSCTTLLLTKEHFSLKICLS